MERARQPKTVLSILGNRAEAIKMAPVIHELQAIPALASVVCVAGGPLGVMDQTLGLFGLDSDYELEITSDHRSLVDLTTASLAGLREVLQDARPDMVLVQGDSSASLAAALATFFMHIPLGHIEAGLRTSDLASPWPEEFNRRTISLSATLHFAPTAWARQNLIAEQIPAESIEVTGNTAVDAVCTIAARRDEFPGLREHFSGRKLVLVNIHAHHQDPHAIQQICHSIAQFAFENPQVSIVWPMEHHPSLWRAARETLAGLENVRVIHPITFAEMVFLIRHCQFVVTDGGSLQEEAAAMGKPVILVRDRTERPEAIEGGIAVLTGTDPEKIQTVMHVLADEKSDGYQRMAQAGNPFGDGKAAGRIARRVWQELSASEKRLYRTSRVQ
ncbi:MAG: hypothetical protein RIQ81_1467 [Pseudomonadota bacterium]|jgi:UDP-N-acetylglucosamine 2-epimerase (non-hydrolysing)